MLYSVDSGVRLNTPAFGRLTPLCADGRSSARTLNADRRLLNGSSPNSAGSSRRTSRRNFGISAAVYPSPITRMSTFSDGGPLTNTGQTAPACCWSGRLTTKRDDGSTSVVQTGEKRLSFCRFDRVIATVDFGQGNRSDS